MDKKYQNIIIDAVNFAFKTFKTQEDSLIEISQQNVYVRSAEEFIKGVDSLKEKYLADGGTIYLLYDNYCSRMDMAAAFTFADRKTLFEAYKANRKKEKKPFYSTLSLLKYYYQISAPMYHVIRIEGLEADDLVKPLCERLVHQTNLLVSSDLDWCRYLSEDTDVLQSLGKPPKTRKDVSDELGFPLSESSLIAYKALFGDKSDNIPQVVTASKVNKADFIDMAGDLKFPQQVIAWSRNPDMTAKHPLLKELSTSSRKRINCEKQFLVNIQLISSIDCAQETLQANEIIGRDAYDLRQLVRTALGLDQKVVEFEFKALRRPRTN